MSNKIFGYTVVSYPESMPDGWKIKLNNLPFGYAYSLHDKDVDENGDIKKAHIHFFFQGVATKKQKEYIHESLGVSYGENVKSASGMYDYLTHENNEDKYHYPKDNIKYSDKWCQELFDSVYVKKIKQSEIIEFIEINNILEFRDLMLALDSSGKQDLLSYCSKQYWVRSYLDSKRNSLYSVKGADKRL